MDDEGAPDDDAEDDVDAEDGVGASGAAAFMLVTVHGWCADDIPAVVDDGDEVDGEFGMTNCSKSIVLDKTMTFIMTDMNSSRCLSITTIIRLTINRWQPSPEAMMAKQAMKPCSNERLGH